MTIKTAVAISFLVTALTFAAAIASRQTGLSTEEISEKVLPTVVQVGVAYSGNPQITTIGSGTVVRSDGWILTARHNITEASHVFIKLTSGEVYPVGFCVVDAHRDLALLKINPKQNLTAIQLGGSQISVGQEIMAFGFPAHKMVGGLSASASKGVVSAVERIIEEPMRRESGTEEKDTTTNDVFDVQPLAGLEVLFGTPKVYVPRMLQVDAMVNPGSSGGAIVDTRGRLIAVINSQITNTGSNVGLNFAIPIDEATANILGLMGSRKEIE